MKADISRVTVGSVFGRVSGHRLAVCEFCSAVFYSLSGSPREYRVWNMCSLDKAHCGSSGKCLKFSSHGVDSLCVIWVCPKLGLPMKGGSLG